MKVQLSELIDEHRKLIETLKKGTDKDKEDEATKQEGELDEYLKKSEGPKEESGEDDLDQLERELAGEKSNDKEENEKDSGHEPPSYFKKDENPRRKALRKFLRKYTRKDEAQ